MSFIGLGVTIAFAIIGAISDDDLFKVAGLGFVCLFVGLAFIVNGLMFSVPKKIIADKSSEGESQRRLDYVDPQTSGLKLPESNQIFTSVTEETTRQLKEKQPVPRS